MNKAFSRNVFSVLFGRGITLFLNFIVITIAARILGVENFGLFTSTLALVTILSKVIDFGLSQIVFRETAKNDLDFSYINNSLSIRFIIFIIVILLYNAFMFSLQFEKIEIYLTNIFFINILISSRFLLIRDLFETLFKVNLQMHLVMIFNIIDQLLLLAVILLLPSIGENLVLFTLIYAIANLPGFILLLVFLKRKFDYNFSFDLSKSKWLIKESLPLFGYVLISTIFVQSDILILKSMDGVYSAGIFAAASRITMPLSIIPVALVSSIFPIIVKNIKTNPKSNELLIRIIFKLLFLVSFLFALIILLKVDEVTLLIFGPEYAEAASPLIFLLCANIFLFLNFFSLDLLTAYNKQKFNVVYATFVTILNISILLMLLSSYSYVAAGVAKLIATLAGFILLMSFQKILRDSILILDLNFIMSNLALGVVVFGVHYTNLFFYLAVTPILIVLLIKFLPVLTKLEKEAIKKVTGDHFLLNYFLT